MANELFKQEQQQVTGPNIQSVIKNVQVIQHVLREVMVEKTHYDVIPGCGKKKSLLKPGAEVIMSTFQLGSEIEIEKESDGFDLDYTIKARGFYIPTGNTVGYGVGSGSTREDKYAWRAAECNEEYEATQADRRRIHYKKDNGKVITIKQVRINPATVMNTVLKMAKKRALVDFCLTATACSDMFVQDLDEDEIRNAVGKDEQPQGNNYKKPQRREQQQTASGSQNNGNGVKTITEAQEKRLWAIAASNNVPREEVEYCLSTTYNVKTAAELPMAAYDGFIEWLQLPVAPAEGNAQ